MFKSESMIPPEHVIARWPGAGKVPNTAVPVLSGKKLDSWRSVWRDERCTKGANWAELNPFRVEAMREGIGGLARQPRNKSAPVRAVIKCAQGKSKDHAKDLVE